MSASFAQKRDDETLVERFASKFASTQNAPLMLIAAKSLLFIPFALLRNTNKPSTSKKTEASNNGIFASITTLILI